MATEWGAPLNSPSATPPQATPDSAEHQFLDALRALRGSGLTAADGVERAVYVLVDELRHDGLRCEQALLAVKALVRRAAAHPDALLTELVPLCIVRYYASER
jgi:hypothetical protein